ncbi:MAG TPA: site-specific DNA-methyltransferase [bacterium]|nr:site-specific DNA-methyltransferase [bacterium]
MKNSRLRCGDALKILKTMPDNSIDLTITSPPYDGLRLYGGHQWSFDGWAKSLSRVTKPGGVAVWIVNDAVVNGSETGSSFRQALGFISAGWRLHDTMIWRKPSFRHPDKIRYGQVFEYMFVFSKGKPKTVNLIKDRPNKWANYIYKESQGTYRLSNGEMSQKSKCYTNKPIRKFGVRHNVWNVSTYSGKNTGHPAMFSYELARDHILTWSNEGDWVLDPMCGSGTSILAAANLKRKYIGIDIEPDYVAIARRRLKGAFKKI